MLLRPIAFRIRNYKSIRDSGQCTLSGDGITVLAGQNEAGKSSILQALADFTGDVGKPTTRPDIVPDDNTSAVPSVEVEFKFDRSALESKITEQSLLIPPPVLEVLEAGACRIGRNLLTGNLELLGELHETFTILSEIQKGFEEDAARQGKQEEEEQEAADGVVCWASVDEASFLQIASTGWPEFVYFDSFDDLLPRKVSIEKKGVTVGSVVRMIDPVVPEIVEDYLQLAKIDLSEVLRLAELNDDEKQLRNYLSTRSGLVTGDFLGYWKQRTGSSDTVKLRTEFSRRAEGAILLFYIETDGALQFADQRSRGFLWFLSFYIKLAAEIERDKGSSQQFILIDEPGSFLHPKAQQDILDVLQRRINQDGDLVMYSTHSPYLLPSDYLHRVRIVFKQENGKAVIADRLTDSRIRGASHGDALGPVMTSIGMTVEARLSEFQREMIIVEGISDYYYLQAFVKLTGSELLKQRGIIVATGTPNVPYSVSLALAYAQRFAVLLDHDSAGEASADKLRSKMNISGSVIVQPSNAKAVEDLFSNGDFAALVAQLDSKYTIDLTQTPTVSIKKHGIDKILLSRRFAELVSSKVITPSTLSGETFGEATQLLARLENALKQDPVFRIL